MGKKKKSSRSVSVYSNLVKKHKTKRDAAARKKAEYLATLPKHPVKRFLYRMHPKSVAKFWFSKRGLFMALKLLGVFLLIMFITVGSLVAYFRKDLAAIRPGEIDKRVQTTVTKYYDRNDKPLWEDKGVGDYKLVVEGDQISEPMKQATVAIEDKDFYKHSGISPTGIIRAAISNSQGNSAQGGSTLTQQLVKQVFFPPEEAQQRGLAGIPRKIKEMILAIEVERMYNKDQIINLYLNESPYGGRRNGVESAARTYFNKPAKELTLAESALLASIPNQPGWYDPYNIDGHKDLIARQHKTLDSMVDMKYITRAEADEAKAVPILDSVRSLQENFADMRAPHFVLMVRRQLEQQLGKATVGNGGLIVKTTLDLDIQTKLEEEMNSMFSSSQPDIGGFTNGAAVLEDVQTGQIVALMGSRDFNYAGYGQDNATTAFIQPGSSIKPLIFAQLFQNQGEGITNYGSGTMLADNPTTFDGNYRPQNADGGFRGNINIRQGLALSRNIPAIKAMAINEQNAPGSSWKTIRELGDKEYCTQGPDAQAGLSSAIGGCGTKMVDHVNALASLARMGAYMPHTGILEVKSSTGQVLKKFKAERKQVIDPQAAYIVNDILADTRARSGLFGRTIVPNVESAGYKMSVKTGTSDKDKKPKDIWTLGYTPQLSMGVWLGNPDTSPLRSANSSVPARILDPVMAFALQRYRDQGVAMDWFAQPDGIQKIGNEIYPSYFNRNNATSSIKMIFDRVSKKKATDCTPEAARIEIGVFKAIDPFTKKELFTANEGYNPNADDDVHDCADRQPNVSVNVTGNSATVTYSAGKFTLQTVEVRYGGTVIASQQVSASGTWSVPLKDIPDGAEIVATVTDTGYYSTSDSDEK